MIIDQLPLLAGNALTTDEIPLERGTTTYKAELSQLFGLVYDTLEPNFAGAYDSTATYAVGDYVVYEHNLYVCNTDISTAEQWTAAHWTQINVATELLALDTNKQDTLVSGTNIKTVGGQSLLGSGNIEAGGGVNRNLLDNAYFVGGGSQLGYGTFPINQRGQTTYTNSGYVLDRWIDDGYVTTVINSDHIDVSKSDSAGYRGIAQIVKASGLSGKTLTFSVLFAGTTTGQARFSIMRTDNTLIDDQYSEVTTANQFGVFSFSFVCTEDTIRVALRPNEIGHMLIKAVKLEIGDTQTLAHEENDAWVLNEIPNYSEELLKCQRYLVKFNSYQRKRADAIVGNSIDFLFPIPCTMASLPTSVSGIAVHLYGSTETAQTGFTFSASGQGGGYIQIRATKTSHGLTDATCYGTDSWYLSCEP